MTGEEKGDWGFFWLVLVFFFPSCLESRKLLSLIKDKSQSILVPSSQNKQSWSNIYQRKEADAARISELQEMYLNRKDLLQKQSTSDYVRQKALEGVHGCTVLYKIQSYIRWYKVTVLRGGNERLSCSLQEKVWPLGKFVDSEINEMRAFLAGFQCCYYYITFSKNFLNFTSGGMFFSAGVFEFCFKW